MLAKLCRADRWPEPAPLSSLISEVLILALQKVLRLGLANIAFPATQNGVASQKNDYAKLNAIRGPNQNARDKIVRDSSQARRGSMPSVIVLIGEILAFFSKKV
jgi:hypothetical protein